MNTPSLAFFVIGCISSVVSRFGLCYDESPWQPSYDYYHIDLAEIEGHHGGHKVALPRDVVVDVVNDLGIKLLAIHNEDNENNIAISPYGALSVLVALTEGVQGDAAHEILHAAHIPADKHIMRVGLRDIHRHLKSYFIPEEGFLAGLTLNLNNVTLRSEYEDVLRFYGFDYGSFNNALYPEPPTTQKPIQVTTLGTTLGMFEASSPDESQTTTMVSTTTQVAEEITQKTTTESTTSKETTTTDFPLQGKEEVSTEISTPVITTTLPSTTTSTIQTIVTTDTVSEKATTITPETVSENATTITPETVSENATTITPEISTFEDITKLTPESSTTSRTSDSVTTQESTTLREDITVKDLSTDSVLITTTIGKLTTTISNLEVITKAPETVTLMSVDEIPTTTVTSMSIDQTTESSKKNTTEMLQTITTDLPTTTTVTEETEATSMIETTAETTNSSPTSTITTERTESSTVTPKNMESLRTTREIPGTMIPIEQSTTITTDASTLGETTITSFQELTTTFSPSETTIPFVNPVDTFAAADAQDNFINPPVNTPTQIFDELAEELDTTTPFFFGTTPEYQDMTNFDQIDYNYNYDGNEPFTNNNDNNSGDVESALPPVYDDNSLNLVTNNVMVTQPEGASLNRSFKRKARSVVDYVIARYYDDHQSYAPPPQRQYLPQLPSQRPSYGPQFKPPKRPIYVPRQEPLTFAIYGKYPESGINFMKYDTVLPFLYVPNLHALALSFPLDSSKYYLLLLLPLETNGVDQLICDLRLHGNLRYIVDHLKLTHVVATIPSFMLKGYVSLTPLLQRLGIRKVFEPRQADFSPMTNVTDIYVTNIEQAVTVTIRNYLDPSAQHYKNVRQYPPVDFKADHPFLYFVIDSELHVALMVGKVINPLNSRIR